ncbi:hypothetical protein [Devosia salina]|uniref:Uncharacterized protein n=1 Tax=Devosia salina TaxID=2860336 RepID=A0ABX8WBP0_9HYPH|nr:hypothetical protein [Devosia salina]QYO75858.1 hypothetical protein K1X15_14635 [Devosia salina]
MTFSRFVRQFHRWTSIAFTLTVIANFVAIGMMGQANVPPLVTYSPLLPLFLLLFSGLFMFLQPYAARWRGARTAA